MAEATAAAAAPGEPTIDPNSFDLIVSGTGLGGSLIAAAAAACGKSVLHVDPNPYYGAHFASLSPPSLASALHQGAPPATPPAQPPSDPSDHVAVGLEPRRLYSHVEVSGEVPEPSRGFLLDLSGPRVLYCADPAVDVMLRSGASHHVEFKSVDASLVYWGGRLQTVPDSREAIFKDRSLGLTEKSQMMRFLKLVREHIGLEGRGGEEASKVSEEDLEIPFVAFLEKQKLPPKIKSIVLYAIAMADFDQDNPECCEKLMNTKEGLASLSLYSLSIGSGCTHLSYLWPRRVATGLLPLCCC
uniref:Rab proteins geranylgeranyltransferase component A n=1 Tax=Anthurium amnicola TaxID=1678845 RepID=A0A1D1YDX0_9ARAE